MTSNFYDNTIRRDEDLIAGLCYVAQAARKDLREWVQEEVKALLYEAQLQQIQSTGVLAEQITSIVERLQSINRRDLPEAITAFEDDINEVAHGGYDDVYNAYDQLQKGYAGLMRITRDLLEIRSFIGG